jgi:hypothetical protein
MKGQKLTSQAGATVSHTHKFSTVVSAQQQEQLVDLVSEVVQVDRQDTGVIQTSYGTVWALWYLLSSRQPLAFVVATMCVWIVQKVVGQWQRRLCLQAGLHTAHLWCCCL